MEEPPQYPQNGILQLYNQFPGMYRNFAEMTADLARIKAMGFNAVWINPIHPTCAHPVERRAEGHTIQVVGSLYAISNFREIAPHFGNEQHLIEYVCELKHVGLIPIFDLVLRHVARDINLEAQGLNRKWFKPFQENKEMNDTLDFVYAKPVGETRKQDQVFFDSSEKIWPEIFEQFWIPYINRFIHDYGFGGVRIDAVKHLPPYVIRDVCNYIHRRCPSAVIFGELLFIGPNPQEKIKGYRSLGITHITNSLYSQPFDFESRKRGLWRAGRKMGENNLVRSMLGWLNDTTQGNGGTVGFAGSHDEQTVAASLQRAPNIVKAMKEKIAAVAFTSNGGWYLMCGDEFGYLRREIKIVFERIRIQQGPPRWEENKKSKEEWMPDRTGHDLSLFVTEVNTALARLPQTTHHDWVEHLVLDEFPDLMIVIRNSGSGFEGETRVILINLENNPLVLTEDYKGKIAATMRDKEQANGSSHEYCEFLYNKLCRLNDDSFILVGKIEYRPAYSPRPK